MPASTRELELTELAQRIRAAASDTEAAQLIAKHQAEKDQEVSDARWIVKTLSEKIAAKENLLDPKNRKTVDVIAGALLNARGMRRGAPTIMNVLDLAPSDIVEGVRDDAVQVLEALAHE